MLEEEYAPRRRLPRHLQAPAPAPVPFEFVIRTATPADVPSIREIYNYYVTNSTVTFDERPLGLSTMRAKLTRADKGGYPFLVAVVPSGEIVGFAYVLPWKDKSAYRYTVENSIYLGPAATGKGVGRALMAELLERAKAAGVKEVVAVIADRGADASIALHRAFGFTESGRMGRVGYKFDRWLGTVLMQKSLK